MLEQIYTPVTGVFIRIVSAFVIFIIALIVGKFTGMIVTAMLYELKIEEMLETVGIKLFISRAIGIIISFVIYVAGFFLALNELRIATAAIILTAAFFAIIAVLGISFGVADAIRNFFAGIGLRKEYLKKKSLNLPELKGKIVDVGYTKIKVSTKEKDIVVVPYMRLD